MLHKECGGTIVLKQLKQGKVWCCTKCSNFIKPFNLLKYIEVMEKELSNIVDYNWNGIKQNNTMDAKTNFIYSTFKYQDFCAKVKALTENEKNYAKVRWYNFHTSQIAEFIFQECGFIKANVNKYDKLVDFTIQGINFDHKNTVFPKAYKKTIDESKKNKEDLIKWLYENQSKEQRFHLANRLFIVFYSKDLHHWKAKAKFQNLKINIDKYLSNFNKENLICLNIKNQKILSDIIFIEV